MRPDEYLRDDDPPGAINQGQPQGRPMQDFRPARPAQRPFNDFAPRPSATPQRPMQRPAPQFSSYPQTRPQASPAAPTTPQPQQPAQPMSFEAPKRKRKISVRKLLSASVVAVLLVACAYVFIATGNDSGKKSSVKAQNGQPAIKPLEKTGFITYYPSPMPTGLKPMKGSITYYKGSFTFILEQDGQKSFFVYEQPASTDPGFSSLKSKLAAPKDIALTIGQGIEGGLDNGTVTAVKTDKNTIIMVDCVKAVCSTTARDVLSNMQINSDLESLRRDSS